MHEPGAVEGARLEPTSLVFRPVSQHYAPSWFEIVSLIKAPHRGFQTQAEAPGVASSYIATWQFLEARLQTEHRQFSQGVASS